MSLRRARSTRGQQETLADAHIREQLFGVGGDNRSAASLARHDFQKTLWYKLDVGECMEQLGAWVSCASHPGASASRKKRAQLAQVMPSSRPSNRQERWIDCKNSISDKQVIYCDLRFLFSYVPKRK
jgi:hypothetical protein